MRKPQLKTEVSGQITNITVAIDKVTFKESDRGDFHIVKIGDYEVLVKENFIKENQKTEKNPKGSYSVGIKKNFKYPIYKTDTQVTGVDLLAYYFELHEFNKVNKK